MKDRNGFASSDQCRLDGFTIIRAGQNVNLMILRQFIDHIPADAGLGSLLRFTGIGGDKNLQMFCAHWILTSLISSIP